MPGEEPTSVPDLIQGEWEIRESYLAGGRFNRSESLAVDRTRRTNSGGAAGGSPLRVRPRPPSRCAPPQGSSSCSPPSSSPTRRRSPSTRPSGSPMPRCPHPCTDSPASRARDEPTRPRPRALRARPCAPRDPARRLAQRTPRGGDDAQLRPMTASRARTHLGPSSTPRSRRAWWSRPAPKTKHGRSPGAGGTPANPPRRSTSGCARRSR